MILKANIKRKKDLYYYVLNIMNLLMTNIKLTEGEIKLLALLQEQRSDLLEAGLSELDIGEIIFSSTTRTRVMKELNISYNTYNNIISILRNDKHFIKGKLLHPLFKSLTNFKLTDDKFVLSLEFINEALKNESKE